ncbi:hypothetical protein N0V83_007616 [Neocucurbitaria cava]|uniref:Uncharacterized protein n=1 Tax=Neocucurbitaria cava TaxID=798079 RepID=A0A9W9CKD4_9PLEO|nr:hypothetical protein N0V83_007616 [Neocucurbitaria cava]
MAGRRLVDVAKLFNASKSVAQKHVALRSNQLDVYNKTSTLAKAVKNQTDRVTLTAAAAIALSQRFSEEAPAYAKAAAERATGTHNEHVPRSDTVKRDGPVQGVKDGIEQDHHYDRSGQNTTAEPPREEELHVEQKQAQRRPLPDGTIPTADVTIEQEGRGHDTFSKRPVPEAPKEPLAEDQGEQVQHENEGLKPVESTESTIPLPGQPKGTSTQSSEAIPSHANDLQQAPISPQVQQLQEDHDRDVFYARSVESQPAPSSQPRSQIPSHTETKQGADKHVDDGQLNQDVYYSARKTGQEQAQKVTQEEDISEGINTDVFHSKRVARMLGSDPLSRKDHLERRSAGRHPLDDRPVPQGNATSDTRAPEQAQNAYSQPIAESNSTTKEMEDFASQLAQDVQSNAAAAEVPPTYSFA